MALSIIAACDNAREPVMRHVEQKSPTPASQPVGLLATIGSVLAAFCGIQTSRARVRDFSRGSPALFITVAVVMTLVLVLTLIVIVRVLLHQAGLPA